MNRPEHQVTRFSRVNRGFERFTVSHFPHQHDVGVFSHRMFHRDVEVNHVLPDLTLIDQTLVGRVDEFNRVFDRQNVLVHVAVDPVEHRRNRRTLSGTRHTGQQHHPLVVLAVVNHAGRQEQPFERRNRSFNLSSHHPNLAQLSQQVDSESPWLILCGHDFRKVGSPVLVEDVQVSLVHHRERQFDHLAFSDRGHFQFTQATANSKDRRTSDLQMDVRTFVFHGKPKDLVDFQLFSRVKGRLLPVRNQNH